MAGNMVRAENADAIVERTYHPNGQLRTDTTRIRDFAEGNAFSRVYGIAYGYDPHGRMNRLFHPGNLANLNGIADTDSFSYHPQTGALARARDRNGNVFTFTHAPNGELTSLRMPGAVVDSMRYDLEGRLVWRNERSPAHPGVPLQHETFTYDARGKVLAVSVPVTVDRNTSSTFVQWYSGLGSLVMTDWVNSDNPQWQRERFETDPLGNTVMRHEGRAGAESPSNDHPDFRYMLDRSFGRVLTIELEDLEWNTGAFDKTWYRYDLAGNQEMSYQHSGPGGGGITHAAETRSFYGADDRLRAFQKYDDRPAPSQSTTNGLFEEYRYDPLGRRVAVRTRRPAEICNQPAECYNSITWFVWAGDQLLWEIRETEGTSNTDAGGQVSYFQAGGIDRPLTIWKQDVGTVVTHQSWRGQFARGTFGDGARAGESSDCEEYPAANGCLPVRWPGWNTSAWSQEAAREETTGSAEFWFGSLSVGMRDASGQQYMRNRYYNPQTGQFTQPDPIGLAGGLNSYGFAAGDPVSYSDPYGLCPRRLRTNGVCPGGLSVGEWNAVESASRYMTRDRAANTRASLLAGNIRGANLPGDVYGEVRPGEPTVIYINRTFNTPQDWVGSIFNNERELGRTLVHEGEHVIQLSGKAPGSEAAEYIQQNWLQLEEAAYASEENYVVPNAVPVCTNGGCVEP